MKSFKTFLDVKVLSPEELAAKHKVPIEDILKQLEMGVKVEKEHTTNDQIAYHIALAHLKEMPDYYTRLKKMEG